MSKLLTTTAIAGAVGLALYAGFGYVGVPYLVKNQAAKFASDALGESVTIDSVSFSPWSWTLSLDGLVIGDAQKPMVKLPHFMVDVSSKSVTQMAPVIDALVVDGLAVDIDLQNPKLKAAQEKSAQAPKEEKKSDGLPRLSFSNIEVKNASIHVVDSTLNVNQSISDINIAIPFITTLDVAAPSTMKPTLAFNVNGTAVTGEGTTVMKDGQLQATLHTQFQNLNLVPFVALVPADKRMGFSMTKGSLSVDNTLTFVSPQGGKAGALLINGTLGLNDLQVNSSAGPLASLAQFKVVLDHVDVMNQVARVQSVAIVNPKATLQHTDHGVAGLPFNPHETKDTSDKGEAGTKSTWTWSVDSVSMTGGTLNWIDTTSTHPTRVGVQNASLNVKQLSSDPEKAAQLQASLEALGGYAEVSGTVVPMAGTGSLRANWRGISTEQIRPYIRYYGKVDVRAVTTGESEVTLAKDDVQASANVGVRNFALSANGETPVTFSNFTLDLDQVSTKAHHAVVQSVGLENLVLNVVQNDKGLNLANLAGSDKAKEGEAKKEDKAAGPAWTWSLNQGVLNNATISFMDTTKGMKSPFVIDRMNVNVSNLKNASETPGTLNAQARMAKGELKASGPFNISPLMANLNINVANMDFAALSPMMAAFTGFGAKDGILNVMGDFGLTEQKTKDGMKPIVAWKGNMNLANFDLTTKEGTSLFFFKEGSLTDVDVKTTDPLFLEVGHLVVTAPGTKETKAVRTLSQVGSFVAGLFGEDKTAQTLQKVDNVLDQNISIRGVKYVDGQFSAAHLEESPLGKMILQTINAALKK